MVKFWMVIQSPPVILKMASTKLPAVWLVGAVIVLELPAMVIVFVDVPVAVMLYPPAGEVSFPDSVIVTGDVIVAAFKAVIALAKLG
jgi:hypothetical protein